MSIPVGLGTFPEVVTEIAAGRVVRAVWHNPLGGRTFQVGNGSGREFVKWCPDHPEFDLEMEAAKLGWAGAYATVPEVIGLGFDGGGGWLHTKGIPGVSAVDPRWVGDPAVAVREIALGLRALHDQLPVEDCPFSWSLEHRFASIKEDIDRALIEQAPQIDQLVVCHGDACAPNTLITDDGKWSGHVDLGALGAADRWADVAIATYSLGWNFPGNWESEFFAAYGIEPDPVRIDYYRRLWDAT